MVDPSSAGTGWRGANHFADDRRKTGRLPNDPAGKLFRGDVPGR
jgi:hypothetical protein